MSKTVDELIGVYIEASNSVVWEAEKRGLCPMTLDMQRAGIAAVVRALRDEFYHDMDPRTVWTPGKVAMLFNEILVAAGDEVAEMSQTIEQAQTQVRQLTGITKSQRPDIQFEPAAAPAPAVCVWTQQSLQAFYNSACGLDSMTHGNAIVRCQGHCPSCGKPIAFKGA